MANRRSAAQRLPSIKTVCIEAYEIKGCEQHQSFIFHQYHEFQIAE